MSLVKVDFCNIYWVVRHSSTQFVMSCNPIKLLKNIFVLHARRPTHVEVPHPVAVAEHELPEKKNEIFKYQFIMCGTRVPRSKSSNVMYSYDLQLPCLRHDGGEDAEQQPSHGNDLKKIGGNISISHAIFLMKE